MSKIISPIAIDMGAKNTGVYYTHYQQKSTFEQMDKQGQVLVYGNYTSLLTGRTSNRHVRRGYQRKKLAKRLLTITLKEYFDFPADKHAQALGFLMNRRGFSFLEEEYSKEHLNNLPNGTWNALSEEVQGMFSGQQNIADQLMDFATTNPEKVTELLDNIQNIQGYKKYQKLKKDTVYYEHIKKISEVCDIRTDNKEIEEATKEKNKLSKASKWIVAKLIKENNIGFISIGNKNLLEQINTLTPEEAKNFKEQLPSIKEKQEKTKSQIKESIWNFRYTDFELDKKENDLSFDIDDKNVKKHASHHNAHLHQLCYAVYKINNEIISGGRHRSKFFDEIEDDLKTFKSDNFLSNKHSPKYLKELIWELNKNEKLDTNKLHKLVCHISNFELKPLHKYFSNNTPIEHKQLSLQERQEYKDKKDKKEKYTELNYLQEKHPENYHSHKKSDDGDKFSNKKLSRLASTWFLKHWIVTKEKDKEDKVAKYEALKKEWKSHKNQDNIVDFWLNTEPDLTVPPYQAMLNRHPPKCQSLVLNVDYLNKYYSNWQDWLEVLNPDGKYQEKLQSLSSRKGERKTKDNKIIDGQLINDEKIKCRQLQFILDTAKKQDDYELNEIWGVYHKLQKPDTDKIKWQEKLNKIIEKSKLPDVLKEKLEFNEKESFGHFLNKYFQTRKKARDGRYFLIQEKKEKWLTNNKLLILCTHKPRQKKYQWQLDLAAVLGVNADDLKDEIGDSPEDYFKEIKGFASNCEKADKVQKDHRGELKLKIYHELVHKPNGTLAKLANKCDTLKQELFEKTGINEILADKQDNKLNQKIALVFKFSQIHNIVFKDRSGFSKTCPVCSIDNAFRMQENGNGIVKASRLPALSIRLIDGVVMRICDAIAREIATTKWDKIKDDLQEGKTVSIPLILEQNRFEFEPSLKMIKTESKKLDEITDDRTDKYKGQKVSLYSGKSLGKDGEIDHIIPRTSKYGVLNDEANLIYVSKDDNQRKSNNIKFLKDLHKNYKNEIFGKKSDNEIKDFIYQKLGKDTQSENFVFGKYLNFINLDENQKKAFRHALFLQNNDPLRQKVINALNNRNRTIVNGTQRYLAQCIADKIHRIARKEGKEKLIEFDYFEYSARWDDPKSTYNLRKEYGLTKLKKQPLYSHLIDAQLAFLIASEDHQNDGSMGVKFDDNQTVWKSEVNKGTGEIFPSKLFDMIDIGENALSKIDLSPKDSNQKIIDIEKCNNNEKQNLSKIFKRSIFKQNAIGERYKPIVKFEDKWYFGYPMTVKGGIYNCDEYCQEITSQNKIKKVESVVNDNKYYQMTTDNEQIKIWTIKMIDKKYKQIDKDSHKYFSQLNPKYNDDDKKEVDQIKFILGNCKYYVAKTNVVNAPKILGKQGNDKYPFYKNWIDFDSAWRQKIGDDYSIKDEKYDLLNSDIEKKWNEFCKERFAPPKNQLKNRHQVKGKKYTMTSLGMVSGTMFRINRGGQDIYQAMPLDMQIIGKDKSNFLIKHSKNLALSSKTADKDLAQDIDITEKVKLDKCEIPPNLFFKETLEGVSVYLNNTSVDIENFPLDKFQQYFNKEIDKKSIKLLTENKAKNDLKNDQDLLYADKNKVNKSIEYTTRDGSITNIEVKERLVNFTLPFKNCEKIYNDSIDTMND